MGLQKEWVALRTPPTKASFVGHLLAHHQAMEVFLCRDVRQPIKTDNKWGCEISGTAARRHRIKGGFLADHPKSVSCISV